MVYCVGLTGNIASGKTTVAEFFSGLGVNVIHADLISKELTQKNKPAYEKIVEHFTPVVLNQDQSLNRNKLREIIFSNAQEREWLEQLLHPLIRKTIKERVDSNTAPYCMIEIPLLLTKKAYPYINRILLICAPEKNQIERLRSRDHCSEEQAQAILSAQPPDDLRLDYADEVLMNDIPINKLNKKVKELHKLYLKESLL